jgi:hypothetical protein
MAHARVEYLEKTIPDAFHGTNIVCAQCIMREGFKIYDKPHNYLGHGVYFYESSQWHAWDRAKTHHSGREAVIQATINLGHCLDMNDREYKDFFDEYREKLCVAIEKKSRNAREKDEKMRKLTDAKVINSLANLYPIDTVRVSYSQQENHGDPRFFLSRITKNQKIVICVRKIENIIEWKMVERGM